MPSWLTDVSNFAEVNRLFAEFFPSNPPARMVMQVPSPKGLLISIGYVAATEGADGPREALDFRIWLGSRL
jgi:enamine deaminase RidA (YjgF/YER057c/UK114 family)